MYSDFWTRLFLFAILRRHSETKTSFENRSGWTLKGCKNIIQECLGKSNWMAGMNKIIMPYLVLLQKKMFSLVRLTDLCHLTSGSMSHRDSRRTSTTPDGSQRPLPRYKKVANQADPWVWVSVEWGCTHWRNVVGRCNSWICFKSSCHALAMGVIGCLQPYRVLSEVYVKLVKLCVLICVIPLRWQC